MTVQELMDILAAQSPDSIVLLLDRKYGSGYMPAEKSEFDFKEGK